MNLEKALHFVTHHSEALIQWLFLSILVMSGFLIARSLLGKKSMESGTGATVTLAEGGEMQTFLQTIMERTAKLENITLASTAAAVAGSGGGAVSAEVEAQLQTLKKDLASREQEIATLKAAGDTKPGLDADAINSRIKELEAKLAEYEILEDDIADLSLYKEENSRLKTEIEKIRTAGPSQVETPEESASAEMGSPGDDIVAEFAQAVVQEPHPTLSEELKLTETGDPMQDFESAVKLEKKLTGGEAATLTPAPAPTLTPAPTPASPPAAKVEAVSASSEGDDLFAEFSNAPSDDGPTADASLDTDKMMAEMAALVSIEPTSGGGALEEGIDTEKMALEATSLTKT